MISNSLDATLYLNGSFVPRLGTLQESTSGPFMFVMLGNLSVWGYSSVRFRDIALAFNQAADQLDEAAKRAEEVAHV